MAKRQNIEGQTFGKLTAVEYSHSDDYGAYWKCQCECGGTKVVRITRLRDGTTKSCGCLLKMAGERTKTHGLTRGKKYQSKVYNAWSHMKQRCENPKAPNYESYGGRGIAVCERWRNSFEAFYEDMGKPPTPGHSIGRRNNNGNYEPDNCRWETETQQANNTRANRVFVLGSIIQTMKQISDSMKIPYALLSKRISSGWTLHDAVTIPRHGRRTDTSRLCLNV